MQLSRRIAINSGTLFIGKIASSLFSLVVSVSLARYLGTAGYGNYSIVFAYLSFFQILSGLGIDAIIIREISRTPEREDEVLGNAFLLKSALSLLAFIASIAISFLMGYSRDIVFLIFIASFSLLFGFNSLYTTSFQYRLHASYYTVPEFLVTAVVALLTLLCIARQESLAVFVLLQTVTAVPLTVIYIYLTKRVLRIKPKIRYDAQLCRMLLSESWPIFLSSIFVSVNLRIDQIMLYRMVDSRALGLYSAGVRLAESLNLIPVVFMVSIYPLLCESFVSSREMFVKMYSRSFKYMSVLSIPIALGTTLLADRIILLFYGASYSGAAHPLAVLIWSEVFVFLGVVFSNVLTAAGLQSYLFPFTLVGAASNVILNIFLIPRYGTIGAAIASLISYGGIGLVLQWMLEEIRPVAIHYLRSLVMPSLCSIPMAGFLLIFRSANLFFIIPAAAVIYFATIVATDTLNNEDREYFKSIFIPSGKPNNIPPSPPGR